MECPLCTLERETRRWHEDDVCVVLDCLACGVPMIVLKRHAIIPTLGEEIHMRRVVARLGMVTKQAYTDKSTSQACPNCSAEGHDRDAQYCKFCGAKL